jgi:hypothetical protein
MPATSFGGGAESLGVRWSKGRLPPVGVTE